MFSWQVAMISSAALGALFSFLIALKRRYPQSTSRFWGDSCRRALDSKWSNVFYFSNESLGIFYYLGVIGLVLAPYVLRQFAPLIFILLLAAATAAFLFSVWLVYLQAFALGRWCFWCLVGLAPSLVISIIVSSLFWG